MKPCCIAVTQRVDAIAGRNERRDALDQRWAGLMRACGLVPLLLPNDAEVAAALCQQVDPAGLLLTGGNDIAAYGGDAGERDAVEARLIEWMRARGRPIFAVCRGLQFIAHYFGAELRRVAGHAGTRHPVRLENGAVIEVNSYHNWGFTQVPSDFAVWATAPDGSIEGLRHLREPILGQMWHPERESPFDPSDLARLRQFYGVGS